MASVGQAADAAGAGAATVFFRRVGREFEGGEDFGEKNPVAEPAADEVGVLADEAQAGALGEVAFEQRAGVHVPQRAGSRAAELVDEFREGLEFFAEDVVVIGETGVAGDEAVEMRSAGGGLRRGRRRRDKPRPGR